MSYSPAGRKESDMTERLKQQQKEEEGSLLQNIRVETFDRQHQDPRDRVGEEELAVITQAMNIINATLDDEEGISDSL